MTLLRESYMPRSFAYLTARSMNDPGVAMMACSSEIFSAIQLRTSTILDASGLMGKEAMSLW